MRRFILTTAILATLAGCARDEAKPVAQGTKPGTFTNEATFAPFYGEEVVNGRLHLIGKRNSWIDFQTSKELPPTEMRTLIGKGPLIDGKRMTVVVQTLKDEPAVEARLLATMRSRWNVQ
jgi:hypothetical protein